MTSPPDRATVDHTPGRAQRWPDVDDDLRRWIDDVVQSIEQLDGLVGVYVHGSLATTGMYRPKSDVDVLVVTAGSLDDGERRRLGCDLVALHDRRPLTGALELSAITAAAAARPVHPTPFELHFGENWVAEFRSGGPGPSGNDPDLAAHVTVARARGMALLGPLPGEVFGEVPRAAYLDAILDDLDWIVEGGIVESPFYGVLNVCRCAHELIGEAELPPSKDDSAAWALEHLPAEHHGVIADAVECYRAAAATPPADRAQHGHAWDRPPLLALARWAAAELRR